MGEIIELGIEGYSHLVQRCQMLNATQVPTTTGNAAVQIATFPNVRHSCDDYFLEGDETIADVQRAFRWVFYKAARPNSNMAKIYARNLDSGKTIGFASYIQDWEQIVPFQVLEFTDLNAHRWCVALVKDPADNNMNGNMRCWRFREDSEWGFETNGNDKEEYNEVNINTDCVGKIEEEDKTVPNKLWEVFVNGFFYEHYLSLKKNQNYSGTFTFKFKNYKIDTISHKWDGIDGFVELALRITDDSEEPEPVFVLSQDFQKQFQFRLLRDAEHLGWNSQAAHAYTYNGLQQMRSFLQKIHVINMMNNIADYLKPDSSTDILNYANDSHDDHEGILAYVKKNKVKDIASNSEAARYWPINADGKICNFCNHDLEQAIDSGGINEYTQFAEFIACAWIIYGLNGSDSEPVAVPELGINVVKGLGEAISKINTGNEIKNENILGKQLALMAFCLRRMKALIDDESCFLNRGIWFNAWVDHYNGSNNVTFITATRWLENMPRAWFYGEEGEVVSKLYVKSPPDTEWMSFGGFPSPASWLEAYDKAKNAYITTDSTARLQDYLRAFNSNLNGAILGSEATHGIRRTLADLEAVRDKMDEDRELYWQDHYKAAELALKEFGDLKDRIEVMLNLSQRLEGIQGNIAGEDYKKLISDIKKMPENIAKPFEGLQLMLDFLYGFLRYHRSDVHIFDIEALGHMLIVIANNGDDGNNPDRFFYSDTGTTDIQSLNFYSAEYANSDPVETWRIGNRMVLFTNNTIEFWDMTNDFEDPLSPAYGSNVYSMNVLQNSRVKFNDTLYFIAKPVELDAYSVYSLTKTGQMDRLSHPSLDAWLNRQIKTDYYNYHPIAKNMNIEVGSSVINYENAPIIQFRISGKASILCYNVLFKTFFVSDNMYFLENDTYFQAGSKKIGELDSFLNNDGTTPIRAAIVTVNTNFGEQQKNKKYKSVSMLHGDVETRALRCGECQSIWHNFIRISKKYPDLYSDAHREIRLLAHSKAQTERNVVYRIVGIGMGIDFQTEISWEGFLKINKISYETE
jgi:hypothetical protein